MGVPSHPESTRPHPVWSNTCAENCVPNCYQQDKDNNVVAAVKKERKDITELKNQGASSPIRRKQLLPRCDQ